MTAENNVEVPRATLRGIKSSVAIIVLGIGLLVAGLVIKLSSDRDRCEAGNTFRTQDLPAAFEIHDRHLGEAMGATPAQIDEFERAFRKDLAELLPERDCGWLR